MKQRTKAFWSVGVSTSFFFLVLMYMIFTPFGVLAPKIYESDKFVRRSTIVMFAMSLVLSPIILFSVWYRQLLLMMAWVVIQAVLWQFNIILTLIVLLAIVRESGSNKSPHDAGIFILFVVVDIVWLLCILGIWLYWKLLNDIKHFPIFERYEMEARGGRVIQAQSIDFDSVSMRDFDRLAAFGWRRGHGV